MEHVADTWDGRSTCRVLEQKTEGNILLGRPRPRWVGNITKYVKELGWKDIKWNQLAWDKGKWRAVTKTGRTFCFLKIRRIS